jgi:hypothetical protein
MAELAPEPGPLERRIWDAVPFCEPVPYEDREPDAVFVRAIMGLHLCLLCGRRAVAAIVAWPADAGQPPAWIDLCGRCFMAVKLEQAGLPPRS